MQTANCNLACIRFNYAFSFFSVVLKLTKLNYAIVEETQTHSQNIRRIAQF